MRHLWSTGNKAVTGSDPSWQAWWWGVYFCSTCGGVVLARVWPDTLRSVAELYPSPREAHADVPEPARKFLQQAFDTLHAPDAAAVMAGSAVDAMLKHLGYKDGSLYNRIDQAVADHILTVGMGDWAHEVRLGSNRPRHADEKTPHVSPEEAQQSVEFAEALGHFLFVLTARIERGQEAAKKHLRPRRPMKATVSQTAYGRLLATVAVGKQFPVVLELIGLPKMDLRRQ